MSVIEGLDNMYARATGVARAASFRQPICEIVSLLAVPEAPWLDLAERAAEPNIFFHPAWARAVARHAEGKSGARVLLAWADPVTHAADRFAAGRIRVASLEAAASGAGGMAGLRVADDTAHRPRHDRRRSGRACRCRRASRRAGADAPDPDRRGSGRNGAAPCDCRIQHQSPRVQSSRSRMPGRDAGSRSRASVARLEEAERVAPPAKPSRRRGRSVVQKRGAARRR